MTTSLRAFVEAAVSVGALVESEVKEALPREIDYSADAKEGAKRLVESGKLSLFQANTVYQGKAPTLLLGNYLLLDRLGQGGFGQVFRARHVRMDRVVAIKLIAPQALASPHALQMFQREVKATARLVHPNIVTAFDADEHRGRHFFVMEYIDGRDLSQVVKKDGPLAPHLALNYLVQAARGLTHAHEHGVVHRDIKSSNLVLDKEGIVKILDLGIAQFGGEAHDHEQQNAAAGASGASTISGTVDYMAPEQSVPGHAVDHRADVYSLGCTFYFLLTGKKMYGGSLVERVTAHRSHPAPSLLAARPELPKSFAKIYERMVAKRPEERYPTMRALLDELEPMLKNLETMMAAAAVGEEDSTPHFDKLADLAVATHEEETHVAARPRQRKLTKREMSILGGVGVGLLLVIAATAFWLTSDNAEAESSLVAQGADKSPLTPDEQARQVAKQQALEEESRRLKEQAEKANLQQRLRDAEEAKVKLKADAERRAKEQAAKQEEERKQKAKQDDDRKRADAAAKAKAETAAKLKAEADASKPVLVLLPRRQMLPPDVDIEAKIKELLAQLPASRDRRAGITALLDMSVTIDNDLARQYACHELALRQATELADLSVMQKVLAHTNQKFAIDPIVRWRTALDELKGRVKGGGESLANTVLTAGLGAIPDAMVLGNFDEASKLLAICESVRLPAKNPQLGGQVAIVKKQLDANRKLAEEAEKAQQQLAADASDPSANTTVGRYLCFVRRDWATGLPHLQKSVDKDYKQLADDGLKLPDDARKRRDLGDKWFGKVGTSEPKKSDLTAAAAYFVSLSLPGLTLDERRRALDDVKTRRKLTLPENALSLLRLDEPQLLPSIDVTLASDVSLRCVKIAAGEFAMGSPLSESQRGTNETQHPVKISKPFYLGESEVTQAQYALVMNTNFNSVDANRPVSRVSWSDCQRFIVRLNALSQASLLPPAESGYEFRLPTEAEWEYACRAGTTGPFSTVTLFTSQIANFDGKKPYPGMPASDLLGRLVDVKSYPSNAWGLFDMHGNIKEWCFDWAGGYPSDSVVDPIGAITGDRRVTRGGDRNNGASLCRSAARSSTLPAEAHDWLGFRVCYGPRLPAYASPGTQPAPTTSKSAALVQPLNGRLAQVKSAAP